MSDQLGPIQVQPYNWESEDVDDNDHMQIRVWALDRYSQPYLLRVENFPAYCFVELPTFVRGRYHVWSANDAGMLHERLRRRLGDREMLPFQHNHFKMQRKLYYYHGERSYPMLLVGFKASSSLRYLTNVLNRPFEVEDGVRVKLNVWEAEIDPIRKFLTKCSITHTSWLHCRGRAPTDTEKMSTLEREWIVDWGSIAPIPYEICKGWTTKPGMLSIDGEMYSHRHKMFPDMWNPLHSAYMISCIYQRVGSTERYRYGIVMGDCNQIPPDVLANTELFRVENEEELTRMFAAIVRYHDPEIITGYNIATFDYEYWDARLELLNCQWPIFGRLLRSRPKMYRNNWKSDGYGQNNIAMLQIPGVIMVDALSVVRRDYKMSFYDLNTVAQFFVGKGKHEITAQQMFVIYERTMAAKALDPQDPERVAAREQMTEVMRYCIQDSELVLDILEKIHFWIASVEMSAVAGVTIEKLFTGGQQQRCLSQLYNRAVLRGHVLDNQPAPDVPFGGGHVCEPVKGIHDNIITVDFKSMYPSIIIGYNMCYTTLVPAAMYDRVPDHLCHIIEVEEEEPEPDEDEEENPEKKKPKKKKTTHNGPKRIHRFKFLREPLGILPELVKALIDERNKVKGQMKDAEREISRVKAQMKDVQGETERGTANTTSPGTGESGEVVPGSHQQLLGEFQTQLEGLLLLLVILDKRQNALKIMTNSIFGFLGVRKGGKRPLLEAAMCITAKGRWLIGQVNQRVKEEFGAEIVYGDTDSSMIFLPQITDPSQCDEWGHRLVALINTMFPPPIEMEFEKANRMLLLDKKMYAGLFINKDGSFKKNVRKDDELELLIRGILIARRDNCKWSRDVYRKILVQVLTKQGLAVVMRTLLDEVQKMLDEKVSLEDFVVVRSLNSHYEDETYFMKVFSDELRRIGKPAQPGDRLKYLVIVNEGAKLLGHKMVTPEIYLESRENGQVPYVIDYIYYLDKVLGNHLDKVIGIGCREEIAKWSHVTFRPTNRHKPTGLQRPVRTLVRILQSGASIDEHIGRYVREMELQEDRRRRGIVMLSVS